jgi:hypothetical protein
MCSLSSCQIVLTEAGIIDRVVANADIAGLKTPRVEARSFAIRTLTYQGYLQQARRRRTGRWHRLMSACLLATIRLALRTSLAETFKKTRGRASSNRPVRESS